MGRGLSYLSSVSGRDLSRLGFGGALGPERAAVKYSIFWSCAQGPLVVREPSNSLWISLNQSLPSRYASSRLFQSEGEREGVLISCQAYKPPAAWSDTFISL